MATLEVGAEGVGTSGVNGKVGVGTAGPQELLEVSKSGDPNVVVRNTGESVNDEAGLRFAAGSGALGDGNTVAGIKSVVTQADPSTLKGGLAFSTNRGDSLQEAVRVDDTGRVGIGTSEPAALLHVVNEDGVGAEIRIDGENGGGGFFAGVDDYGPFVGSRNSNDARLVSNGLECLRATAAGTVGIGTSAPVTTLEVGRASSDPAMAIRNATESVSNVASLNFLTGTGNIDDTNLLVQLKALVTQADPSALRGALAFFTNRGDSIVEALRITDAGRVGIGTDAPAAKLHVKEAASDAEFRIDGSPGGGGTQGFYAGVDSDGPYAGSRTVEDFRLMANGAEGMRVTAGGTVAVGIQSATTTLEVGRASSDPAMALRNADETAANTVSLDFLTGSGSAASTNRLAQLKALITQATPSALKSVLAFFTNQGDSSVEAMRIDDGGRVGIGTTAPPERLTVEGGTAAAGATDLLTIKHGNTTTAGDGPAMLFRGENAGSEWQFGRIKAVNSGTGYGADMYFETKPEDGNQGGALSTRMTIEAGGNVGIGTTSPSAKLHIESSTAGVRSSTSSNTNFIANNTASGVFGHISGERDGSTKYYLGLDAGNNFAILNADASVAVTVDTDGGTGKVGVGTFDPDAKLDVEVGNNGDAIIATRTDANAVRAKIGFDNSSGYPYLQATRDGQGAYPLLLNPGGGNVGIGTSSPGNILSVAQGSSTDPIADSWTTYASDRTRKTILGHAPEDELIERLINQPVYRYTRKCPEHVVAPGERTELPKFDALRMGISIDDLETPKEILAFAQDGTVQGIDLLAYVGYLHGCLRALARKVEAKSGGKETA